MPSSVILAAVILHTYDEGNGALFGVHLIEKKEHFVALPPVAYRVVREDTHDVFEMPRLMPPALARDH